MSVFFRGLARYCPSMRWSGGLIGLAALAPLLWLGIVSPAASESRAASAPDRRAQAPAIAVTDDGSIHVIWFDKGAVGEADKKGEKVKGTHHSHQAFADLHYARWTPGTSQFTPSIRAVSYTHLTLPTNREV